MDTVLLEKLTVTQLVN